jgi:NADPH-dependent ferric siderophore reductase
MAEQKPSRGISGAFVRLWRGDEYVLTVTGRTELTPNYLRLHFEGRDLLDEREVHPTMWVRGRFPDGAKSDQRGYPLINADPRAGTVDIEFAMHEGVATRWASQAAAGDTRATVFLEAVHGDDREIPVAGGDVTWVDRKNDGQALVEAVAASACDAADHVGWVACDNRTTRAVAKVFREDYAIPRRAVKAQAYWAA